jgi:hypothetical protein
VPTSSLPLVPWIDSIVPDPTETPLVMPTAPSAPACRLEDLAIGFGPNEFDNAIDLIFTNGSAEACYVWQRPEVELRQSGRAIDLPIRQLPRDVASPVTLRPGRQARLELVVEEGASCVADLTKPVTVKLEFPSGTWSDVFPGERDSGCTTSTESPALWLYGFEFVRLALTANLELPPSAVPGSPMSYAVLLRNDSDEAVSFDPCPVYGDWLPAASTTPTRRYLNCAALGRTLEPHQEVHLAMVLDVPPTALPGRIYWLWWSCGTDTFEADVQQKVLIVAGP